jgi:rhomboid protease GluP
MLPRMRKTSGSMLCPACGKLIGVTETACPFCGAKNPGLFGYAPSIQRLVGGRLDFPRVILITCVALYVASLVLQPEAIFELRGGLFGILSPGTRALYQLGMTGGISWREGWWWTVLTAIYLHGSLLHIVFNMMWTIRLASQVTLAFGPARGFVLFSFAGALGFLVSNVAAGSPTVGASGSIFGLLAALIVYGRRTGQGLATREHWMFAIVMFAFGFMMSSVNNWAHAGGFAGGWIAASVMPASHEKREPMWMMLLALGLLALTAAGFVMSFVNVTSILLGGR